MSTTELHRACLVAACLSVGFAGAPVSQAQPRPPSAQAPAQAAVQTRAQAGGELSLAQAIDRLGELDYKVRIDASARVRRAPAAEAVPALLEASRSHKDGYVRFRALVLLAGFNDPRAADLMRSLFGDPNDRLREVAYAYLEEHPEPSLVPRLVAALDTEEAEFVRPALVRAVAAHGSDPRVQAVMRREVMRGVDFFRASVIEALGDHKGVYAFDELAGIAALEGPLQDDAVRAIGKLGDTRGIAVLARLQREASRELQPVIAASICLLGSNCDSHMRFVRESLQFGVKNLGYQELVRSSAASLADLAAAGHATALQALFEVGMPSNEPARAPVALAVGSAVMRNVPLLLETWPGLPRQPATLLLRDAFDMLEEDYAEERFYAAVRRAFWAAPEDSPARRSAQTLITALEF